MHNKTPIHPNRIRKINSSGFSWIPHNFITGHIESLSKNEIILYYFLITVGDKNGVSYYHPDTISQLLKLDLASFSRARDELVFKDLIAYRDGVYQVLSLPKKHSRSREPSSPVQISQILKSVCISNT